jgi:hypothetical protein
MRIDGIPSNPPLLEVHGIHKTFISRGFFAAAKSVAAVQDVSFHIGRGKAAALDDHHVRCHRYPEGAETTGS